ncbi:MAG: hypothetical protein WCP77_22830 [Roseococcus sp.]
MSPEAKARIARVVMHVYGAAISTAKAGESTALRNYAETILESVVEEEVRRRLAARDGA